MDALWLGLIGVLGTMGGSAVTHFFDLRRWDREVQVENARRLVDLRRETLAEYVDAMFALRRVQLHNWYQMKSSGLDEDQTEVAPEMRIVRERAWAAFGRVALSWDDLDIVSDAERLLEVAGSLTKASDSNALKDEAEALRVALKALVAVARARLRSTLN